MKESIVTFFHTQTSRFVARFHVFHDLWPHDLAIVQRRLLEDIKAMIEQTRQLAVLDHEVERIRDFVHTEKGRYSRDYRAIYIKLVRERRRLIRRRSMTSSRYSHGIQHLRKMMSGELMNDVRSQVAPRARYENAQQ